MTHQKIKETLQAIIQVISKDRKDANTRMDGIEANQDSIRETANDDRAKIAESWEHLQETEKLLHSAYKALLERVEDLETNLADAESKISDHIAGW